MHDLKKAHNWFAQRQCGKSAMVMFFFGFLFRSNSQDSLLFVGLAVSASPNFVKTTVGTTDHEEGKD